MFILLNSLFPPDKMYSLPTSGLYPVLEMSAEKAMATHSSPFAWQIPWTEEPGRLQSMGSLGVGHN